MSLELEYIEQFQEDLIGLKDFIVNHYLYYAISSKEPVFMSLAGAPNSGKSTIASIISDLETENYIIVSQDDIKSLVQEQIGVPEYVANEWRALAQDLSWVITKHVLCALIDRKVNIIYDSTLGNITKTKEIIDYCYNFELNYTFRLEVIYAELPTLLERNELRAGHHVPEGAIKAIFNKIPSNLLQLINEFSVVTFWFNGTSFISTVELSKDEKDDLLLLQRFLKFVCVRDVMLLSVLNSERLRDFFQENVNQLNEILNNYEIYIDCGD